MPRLPDHVAPERLIVPARVEVTRIDPAETGSPYFFEDYAVGERIDHVDGIGVTDSEHRLATRLYQNGARVHFNDHTERQGQLGACIVYGGVVISLARALSFNGLGNCLRLLAINAGSHVNPCRAGDTVYAWSEVLATAPLAGRSDVGALRLRLVATKDRPCHDFPLQDERGGYLAGDPARPRLLGSDLPPGRRRLSAHGVALAGSTAIPRAVLATRIAAARWRAASASSRRSSRSRTAARFSSVAIVPGCRGPRGLLDPVARASSVGSRQAPRSALEQGQIVQG